MFTDQPYIANSIINYEVEIDYLCPRQRWMNGWACKESVKRVPAVSCGTIFLGSSREGETNKKNMWEEEFMTVYLPSVVA